MKQLFTIVVLLLTTITTHGQYSDDTYTVNITGVSSIVLLGQDYQNTSLFDQEANPFNYASNMGTYYPDTDGVIRIELKKGYYEYITGKQGLNGSFYISNRNVYFDIMELPPLCGINTRKVIFDAYRCLSNKEKKKARELFQIAADAGNVKAMFDYSRMCYNGMGGGKNKNHAYHYMNEALKHGHHFAAEMLENFNNKRFWKWYL